MQAELRETLKTADKKTQYDTYARDLLARKSILAHILAAVVDEFKGIPTKEIEKLIDGEIYVGVVPAEPGLTNGERITPGGDRIKGFNTVHSEKQEGTVVFDIVFYVKMKDGLSQIIVNIEAQKDEPSAYDLLNRAIFYACRLVSSQKERDFTGKHFNDLKRVYTIWICMNMDECIWNHVHLADDPIMANHGWKGKLDLLNIILLGVPNKLPKRGKKYELHRLLGTLFSNQLTANERIDILENEYHIAAEDEFREEMDVMCNLSEGIFEQGEARGEARGEAKGMLKKAMETAYTLHDMGLADQQIAKAVNYSLDTVKEWIESYERGKTQTCNS